MEHKAHKEEFSALVASIAGVQKQTYALKQQRFALFLSGFSLISQKLREIYQHLTQGGDASLELIDSLDPFAEGSLYILCIIK